MTPSARFTGLLLLLQVDSALFLWLTGLLSTLSQNTFVLFLVIDLVGFSMISYTYRKQKSDELPGRIWLGAGCCLLIGLFLSTLFFT